MDRINLQSLYRPIKLLLFVLLLFLVVRLLWVGLSPANKILVPATLGQSLGQSMQAVEKKSWIPLAEGHLFGVFEEKKLVSHYRNAPETSLNLLLRGIVSGATDQDGFAIIRNSKGHEAVYRVSRKLPGGGEVRGIFPDRVVLFRGGRYETLRLRLDEQLSSVDESSFTMDSPPVTEAPNKTIKMPLGAGSIPSARSRYALNISAMASSYGLVKVPSGGYRISLGRNASQLVKLGLRNGDIIVSANGVKLDDENAVEGLIGKVLQGDSLSLEVMRHGQKQILQPDLKSLMKN